MVERCIQLAIDELKRKPCKCRKDMYIQGACEKCDIIEELTKIRIKVYEFDLKRCKDSFGIFETKFKG
jgi:hypothetical protein